MCILNGAKDDPQSTNILAAQPAPMRRALERVRRAILKAVPHGEEIIAYKIPTIKLHGRTVLHFAAGKATILSTPPTLASWKRSAIASHRTSPRKARCTSRSPNRFR